MGGLTGSQEKIISTLVDIVAEFPDIGIAGALGLFNYVWITNHSVGTSSFSPDSGYSLAADRLLHDLEVLGLGGDNSYAHNHPRMPARNYLDLIPEESLPPNHLYQ